MFAGRKPQERARLTNRINTPMITRAEARLEISPRIRPHLHVLVAWWLAVVLVAAGCGGTRTIEELGLDDDPPLDVEPTVSRPPVAIPALGDAKGWAERARDHTAAGRHLEAARSWSRAMWALPAGEHLPLAEEWAAASAAPGDLPADPDVATVVAVVAHVLAGDVTYDPAALEAWLDGRSALLDIRTQWLARLRLAELAQWDDERRQMERSSFLAHLEAGVMPERDLPTALRLPDAPRRAALLHSLRDLSTAVERDQKGPTGHYAQLTIAWARARLGEIDEARTTWERARAGIPTSDPIHGVLLALLDRRLSDALQDAPMGGRSPWDAWRDLGVMSAFERYKVERLLDASPNILPFVGNPFANFVRSDSFPYDTDPAALVTGLRETVERGGDLDVVLHGLAVAPAGPRTVVVLGRTIDRSSALPASERLALLVGAIQVAADLGRPDLARRAARALEAAIDGLGESDGGDLNVVAKAAWPLARCGLPDAMRALVATVREREVPPDLDLALDGALATVGDGSDTRWMAAITELEQTTPSAARLTLLTPIAGRLPEGTQPRQGLWARVLGHIEDDFSTNTHFGLAYIRLVAQIAASHAAPYRLGDEGLLRAETEDVRRVVAAP